MDRRIHPCPPANPMWWREPRRKRVQPWRELDWTASSRASGGTRKVAVGSPMRSTAPTTDSLRCSESSPVSRAPPALELRAHCGLSAAIASALSMGTGAFLASRSEAEVVAANVERERQEIVEHPEEEKEELSLFYQVKGIDEATADHLAATIAEHPEAMLQALSAEELGVTQAGTGNPAGVSARCRHLYRTRRNHPGDPVHVHDWNGCDRRRGHRVARGSLPGWGRQVARDAAVLVVIGARDDTRRFDRRWRDVPRGSRTPNVSARERGRSQ